MEEIKKTETAEEQPKKKAPRKKKAAPKEIKGIVFGCGSLNIRVAPFKNARVLCVLKKDTVVTVDMEKSNDLFYSVLMQDGRTGYCMKKYLQIR